MNTSNYIWSMIQTSYAGKICYIQQSKRSQMDAPLRKNEISTVSITLKNINFKWIKYINLKSRTVKFLEEHLGSILQDIGEV